MARLTKTNPTNDYIAIADIRVDPIYQRGCVPAWVSRLADRWDENAIGMICVSRRSDGLFYVIDGQHRYEAALRVGVDLLPAEIWHNLTVPEEAAMFLQRNDARAVRAFDKFLAAVEAGSPDQCDILKIVHAAGWELGDQDADGTIRAVNALERVYGATADETKDRRPEALRVTLETLKRAWGSDQDAAAGYLLDGLGKFIIRYDDQIDLDVLIRKLSKYDGGPTALVGRSKELRSFIRTTVPNCVAELIVELYNTGLRTRKLSAWRT